MVSAFVYATELVGRTRSFGPVTVPYAVVVALLVTALALAAGLKGRRTDWQRGTILALVLWCYVIFLAAAPA